jgi:hypothetical protein
MMERDLVRICLAGWFGGDVSKSARGFSSSLVRVVAFLLTVATFLVAGQAPSAPGYATRERIARAADTVLTAGPQAKIPPHVSDMLGISSDQKECEVSQRFERNGKVVRGFDVSRADKSNIVLFVVDEAKNEQTFYLTSGRGTLRRVLAVREGTGHVLPVTAKEKAVFEKELQFWLDRIVPSKTSK